MTRVAVSFRSSRRQCSRKANSTVEAALLTPLRSEKLRMDRVGNEVRQRASKDLANSLNLAMGTIYTFLLFFCCFGCHRGGRGL